MNKSASEIISATEELLQDAKFGLDDMRHETRRFRSGFRNAVVFGRSVTFSLQNLRGKVPDFEIWYSNIELRMRNDDLMVFFKDIRNEIIKQASVPIEMSVELKSFNNSFISEIPRPINARSFFIGDQMGGSGWEIILPDGKVEKYYVDLPPDNVIINKFLKNAPSLEGGRRADAVELVAEYLRRLEDIVKEARERFF